jgi:catechol 2,3-dioxygenase-like lactoylglutathione lyase family enzyme
MKRRTLVLFAVLLAGYAMIAQEPKPTRPRIRGLGSVTINVENREAALDFYSKKLGLIPGVVCDGAPHTCLGIGPGQRLDIVSTASPAEGHYLGEIAFVTEDIHELRRYLDDRHIKTSEITKTDESEGHYEVLRFTALDPEGHSIGFLQLGGCVLCMDQIAEPDPRVSSWLIHAGFVVHDRAAEDRFYRDILGFHVYWHGGMKDDKDDWVDMQVPIGNDWIEYMLNVPANADHHRLGVMNHIALGVPDIQAARERLIKNGWKPGEEPKIGRDGKWQLNLYDPDETRVELMEFTPTKDPCCAPYTGPHPGHP